MKHFSLTIIIALVFLVSCNLNNTDSLNLSGKWSFKIDPDNLGETEKWYNQTFTEKINLPGSMAENNKGFSPTKTTKWTGDVHGTPWFNKPENHKYLNSKDFKWPFWLTPNKYYVGAAWYNKDVIIPKNWKNKDITLTLERCHWETTVWVDGKFVNTRNTLGTPHLYNLTSYLSPGKHKISIRVDNSIKKVNPGVNSHSISDHTQSNWNGIVGEISLKSTPKIKIENIKIFPDIKSKSAKVRVKIINNNEATSAQISLKATNKNGKSGFDSEKTETILNLTTGVNNLEFEVKFNNKVLLWDEFDPNLYNLNIELTHNSGKHSKSVSFGMREFKAEGTQFTINGNKTFLRGTLECCIFPKTGYPPTREKDWIRIFKICRDHGLNHMRFHSYCPPKAAFIAADKAGFYLQVECSSWANQGVTIGDNKPIDKWLYKEAESIINNYGNHPSFCLFAYGNEPAGKNQAKYLNDFVNYWKERDNRFAYTSAAGWPNIPDSDFISSMTPRIQGWGEGLNSIINSTSPSTDYDWSAKIKGFNKPVVSHEIGQWCVYPNFKEIPKYKGVLKATNFEIFREQLANNGMSELSEDFLMASGKLQSLCYKADIEAALRTPGFGGFQLLDLHDFPGQGTALVGVLDAFWDEKGYISPKEFKKFCNSTVPLARFNKRVFNNNETLKCKLQVAHFGKDPLQNIIPKWALISSDNDTIAQGEFSAKDIELKNDNFIGDISIDISSVVKPTKCSFIFETGNYSNNWDLWIYPENNKSVIDKNISIVSELSNETIKKLRSGAKVILSIPKGKLKSEYGGDIKLGFSSIFWNTAWTAGQPPHTLGVLVNPEHNIFNDFSTDYHSNWQWWDIITNSQAINLNKFTDRPKPLIRVIDDWFTNRPLLMMFETKVGKGKLIVTSIDYNSTMDNRPASKQLLKSVFKYMNSNDFKPEATINIDQIKEMLD